MTRAETADVLDNVLVGVPDDRANDALALASDELRKTGATCGYFKPLISEAAHCKATLSLIEPDGSCHCHRWESK